VSREIEEEKLGTAETLETIELLDWVGVFRTEAFDLLEALSRRSTRALGDPALPEATAEMQGLVNVLGDVERLLSALRGRPAPSSHR
jgi:hypothetical protein